MENENNGAIIDELSEFAGAVALVDHAGQQERQAAQGGEAEQPEQAAPSLTPEEDARQIVDLIAWGVEQIFPVLGYKEETKAEGAKRLAPLMVKYNLQQTLMGQFGAEIQAGLFFGGVVFASVQVVKKRSEEEQAEHKKSWFAKFFKWQK